MYRSALFRFVDLSVPVLLLAFITVGLSFSLVVLDRPEVPRICKKGIKFLEEKDYDAAVGELWPLAEEGHACAQVRLAFLYQDGRGVPQDPETTVYWFRRAAEQGDANGRANLGHVYLHGKGVAKDEKVGFNWIKLAAEQGDNWAQLELGGLYLKGTGTEEDKVQALMWWYIAAEQRIPILDKIRYLEQGMTPEEKKAAEKLADAWLDKDG